MDIDIFYQIRDICIEKLENKPEESSICDWGLDIINSINNFIQTNELIVRIEDYYIISDMINNLFIDRDFEIKIEDKDFKMSYRFKAKHEIKKYIEKLKLGKEQQDYEIDLDDLDDIEFLLKEYDLVDEKIVIYELLSDIYYNHMEYDKEYEYLLKAWELMNRYPPEKTNYRITIKLANNYLDARKYKEVIRLYQKALIEIDYIPNKYKLHLYYNYALANRKIKMYSFALGVLEDLLKYTEREDYNLWANAYILKGICHYELEDYDQAIVDYNKALQVLSFVGYTNKKELIYYNIAICYIRLNDLDSTYKYLDGILEGLKDLEEVPMQKASVLYKLGRLYRELDKYKESEEHLKESLQIAIDINYKEKILLNVESLIELNEVNKVENILDIIDKNLKYICEDMQKRDKLKIIFKSLSIYNSQKQNEKLQNLINKILELI